MGGMAIMAAIEIARHEQQLAKRRKELDEVISYWGVLMTKEEELKWQKFYTDRNNCPALNTITHEERVRRLNEFLNFIRNMK